jgi:hypothetical protein
MGNAGGAMGGGMQRNRVVQRDGGGTMDGAVSSERQTKVTFLYFRLVFISAKVIHLPAPDFATYLVFLI